jgi:hypothetical protein
MQNYISNNSCSRKQLDKQATHVLRRCQESSKVENFSNQKYELIRDKGSSTSGNEKLRFENVTTL